MTEGRSQNGGTKRGRLAALLTSPAMFLRDVDPVRGVAFFSPMTEESYRASSFLDNRIVRAGERDVVADLDDLLEWMATLAPQPRDIDYILHTGHCGSTLLSRILGQRDCFLSIREPPLLMGLSRSLRALDRPGFPISRPRWEAIKELGLLTLAKTWRDDQVPLVKPTSQAGNLIPTLMSHTGRERALLLYVDLETYLATMLRSHIRREIRLYAREFRVREFTGLLAGHPDTSDEYSDGQLTALSWLLQTRELALAEDDPANKDRVMRLRFETFLDDPPGTISRLCEFLGRPASMEECRALASEEQLGRSAKLPEVEHGREKRRLQLRLSREKHGDEIARALEWAEAVCETEPFRDLHLRFA